MLFPSARIGRSRLRYQRMNGGSTQAMEVLVSGRCGQFTPFADSGSGLGEKLQDARARLQAACGSDRPWAGLARRESFTRQCAREQ